MKTQNLLVGFLLLIGLASFANAGNFSVSLDSPANNIWNNTNTVELCCSCIGNYTTDYNITYWVGGANVSQNLSVANNTVTCASYTFSSDQCSGSSWNCECFTANETGTNSSTRTIYTDTAAPTISYDTPTKISVKRGEILGFTTSDNCGVNTRWWSRDGGVTNSTTFLNTDDIDTTDWLVNIYTVRSYLNDSAGNNISDNITNLVVRSRSSMGFLPATTTIPSAPLGEVDGVEVNILNRTLFSLGNFNVTLLHLLLIVGGFVVYTNVLTGSSRKPRRKKSKSRLKKKRK